ncbi:hypothetical protein [Helicobacter turcicus]|uniref:NADH dehydrogenase subunit F n=1 Tax=Helicobacter turcicus TaxID=2867412 RepID=A0ABS7JL90_9HELI|nr:hypothetical protein [Helicobacter turcicus]MBX7490147.1 hypothetical protein [Helicobacter turcicus]MBX7545005.1 hypothetical protein [Helicobacter turcicus]
MNMLMQTFLKNGGIACDLSVVKEAQNVLLFGGFVEDFSKVLENEEFKIDSKQNSVFLLHPLHFNPYGFTQFVYEVGVEEAIVALLAYGLSPFGSSLLQDFAKTLDVGYLASECNFSEEELEQIVQSYEKCGLTLLVGSDLATHKNVENIAKILALLSVALKNLKLVFLESEIEKILLEHSAIQPLEELGNYDGLVVYVQENAKKNNVLEVSRQFCMVSKAQDGIEVKVKLESHQEVLAKMQCNTELKGMVGILWTSREVLQNGFCYQLVSLSKVA